MTAPSTPNMADARIGPAVVAAGAVGDRPPAHWIATEADAVASARRLAAAFAEGAARRDAERILPFAEMDALSASGLLAIAVPREYGGLGASAVTVAEVIAILAEADGSIGQIPQNHFYILEALRIDGSEAQKQFFFGRVLAGDRFGNALSEAGSKTVGHYETTIRAVGDRFRIDGRKFYSTGVLYADWIAVFASDPSDRLHMAFVRRGTDGLTLIDDWAGFGQRVTGSGSTVIEHLLVEADSVVEHQRGFDRPSTIGSFGQIIHAAVDLGIARGALAETIDFVRHRSRPWMDAGVARAADDPLTIVKVGDLSIRIDAAAAVVAHAARLVDAAQASGAEADVIAATIAVAGAKVLTTEAALEASSTLFELAGTRATNEALNLDRYWRNARTHTLHDPVRWKFHVVGNWRLNGATPPRNGAL